MTSLSKNELPKHNNKTTASVRKQQLSGSYTNILSANGFANVALKS